MPEWRTRLAAVAVFAAACLAGVTGMRAIRVEPPPTAAPEAAPPALTDSDTQRRMATDPGAVAVATARNPFHPERRRGGVFRMPGEDQGGAVPDELESPGMQGSVRLVGTAVSGDGDDFVMCAVGGEPPRIVRPGGRCGEMVLEEVSQGRAEFTNPTGERVVLEVPRVGSS